MQVEECVHPVLQAEVKELRFAKAAAEMEMKELQAAYEAVSDTTASLEVWRGRR